MNRFVWNSRAWALIGLGVFLGIAEPSYATTVTVINNDGAGEGLNDPSAPDPDSTTGGNPGATLGAQRLIAFQFAADLWEAKLVSTVEINVDAEFNPLPCNATSATLGLAEAITVHRNFVGAPFTNTWYVAPLANALAGADLNPPNPNPPSENDIRAQFNSSIGTTCAFPRVWYYGLDGNPPGTKFDFVTIVLHELTHGFGFTSTVDLATGAKLGSPPGDDAYMRFLENHATGELYPDMTDAERVTASTAGANLHWTGPEAITCGTSALSSGRDPATGHIEMFAPNPAQPGSVSHWSTTPFPNQLMEPRYTGPLSDLDVLVDPCLLVDLGWTVSPPPPPPQGTCNGLPATLLGTFGNDTLVGTPGNDVIHGRGGNDIIRGLGGRDVICGGSGADQLFGNQGKDQLYGGFGNDVLKGGTDNDRLFGQEGNDAMDGQTGNDDNCNGGSGTDTATNCEQPLNVP